MGGLPARETVAAVSHSDVSRGKNPRTAPVSRHTLTAMAGQLSPCSVPLATANRKELAGVSLSCEGVIPLQPYVLSPHAHSNAAPFLRRLSQPGSTCASSPAGPCELRTTARSEAGWDTVWQVALLISQLCGTLFMETCVYPEGHENR